ncbi:MAG: hypothetical protein O3B87_02400 [bacterium]|nr:hypothetical protein [bacterium]
MKLDKLLSLALLFFVGLLLSPTIYAHPGNTASDGCHYCRTNCAKWGEVSGARHCHGGYTPPPVVYYDPTPTPIIIPSSISGSPTVRYDDNTKTYDVYFNWDDWGSSDGWSIEISTSAGSDPGPIVDTTDSSWNFKNIYPGRKYINVKASVNGYWSNVSYWTVDVPSFPTLTPTPTLTLTPTISPSPTITPKAKQTEVKGAQVEREIEEQPKNSRSMVQMIWRWLIR